MHGLSSGAFSARERSEACRNFFGAPMVGLEFEATDSETFGVDVAFGILTDIRIGAGRFSDFSVARTPTRIAQDGRADFALIISRAGEHVGTQCGREAIVGPGGAILTTDAAPASVRFGHSSEVIVLQPSRTALSALVPDCDDAVARPIDAGCEALRLLTGYAALLQQSEALANPAVRHLAAIHLLDLVALTVGATRDARVHAEGRGLAAARLAAIKDDVEAHLLRPDLSIGAVAARQRITPRYVARLFAGEATTFTDYVRGRRLERARRRLVDPRDTSRPIGAIAFECGFGDLSYFNRCFRARFGTTPSAIRGGAHAGMEQRSS